jgi:kinesin family protein 6/9
VINCPHFNQKNNEDCHDSFFCFDSNEEEALNLLFIGDTNRIISSTPMNMASSRSHCIFTAHIVARKAGEDTIRKSKLNLVDLAGSERVWKSGVDGQV